MKLSSHPDRSLILTVVSDAVLPAYNNGLILNLTFMKVYLPFNDFVYPDAIYDTSHNNRLKRNIILIRSSSFRLAYNTMFSVTECRTVLQNCCVIVHFFPQWGSRGAHSS